MLLITLPNLIVGGMLLLVGVEAIFSYFDNTFHHGQWRHMRMPFTRNWAISLGQTLIWPWINLLILPHLRLHWRPVIVSLIVGHCVAMAFHRIWWDDFEANEGHVIRDQKRSGGNPEHWMKDITSAGWANWAYMTLESAILMFYVVTPMPREVVASVGILSLVLMLVVNLQAKLVQKSFNWRFLVGTVGAVLVATLIKL